MHSTTGPAGTTFSHNGDFSGAVIFDEPSSAEAGRFTEPRFAAPFNVLAAALAAAGLDSSDVVVGVRGNNGTFSKPYTDETFTVTIPTIDLATLVGERIREERIAHLEAADAATLVGSGPELGSWAIGPRTFD